MFSNNKGLSEALSYDNFDMTQKPGNSQALSLQTTTMIKSGRTKSQRPLHLFGKKHLNAGKETNKNINLPCDGKPYGLSMAITLSEK